MVKPVRRKPDGLCQVCLKVIGGHAGLFFKLGPESIQKSVLLNLPGRVSGMAVARLPVDHGAGNLSRPCEVAEYVV